ncbi:MAG: GspH/FimT family pseudopilin [Armatimonadota bacterium]
MFLRPQRGLTLIETTIVGAIAVIVVVASLGQSQEFQSNQRLQAWTDNMATDLRAAQQISVSRRQIVIAVFATGQYTISAGGTVVKVGQLPSDLASTSQTITFSSLGATATAGTIILRSLVTNRTKQVSVASGTGRVRVD